ncbi:hypothetical protein DFH05DRAFT_1457856 [Lentinula detonsa]|uniref:Uncharacterized protein n=1 Tax=Lentinula detonsa TaxID=2804962 RepID=A0A9W8P5Y4_9AGAR|nr:hypothetical protein DFH05DRAFT_1457856 [Lentinula detonsa]
MVYSRSIVVAIIAASAMSALAAPVPDGAGGKHSEGTTFQKGNSTGSGDMQQNKGPKHGHGHGHGHRHGHKHNDTMSVVPPDTTGTSSPLVEDGNPGSSTPLNASSTAPDNASSMDSSSSNSTDSSSTDSASTVSTSKSPSSKTVHTPLTAGSRRELPGEEGHEDGKMEQKKKHNGKGQMEKGGRKKKHSNTERSEREGKGGKGGPGDRKGGSGGRKQRKKGGNNKRGSPESERFNGKHESKEHGESKYGGRQRQPQIDRRYPQAYGSDLD